MNRLLLVVLFFVFAGVGNVSAQENKKEAFKQELNLTPEQEEKIDKIDEKYAAEEEQLRKEFKALKQKRIDLLKRKRAEIEGVLTPEQKKKAKSLGQEMRGRGRG